MAYWSQAILDTTSHNGVSCMQIKSYTNRDGNLKGFISIKPSIYYNNKRYEQYLSAQVINADYFVYGLTVVQPQSWQTTKYEIQLLTNLIPDRTDGKTHSSNFVKFILTNDNGVYKFYGPDGVGIDITSKVVAKINNSLIQNNFEQPAMGVYEFEIRLALLPNEYTFYVGDAVAVNNQSQQKLHYANNHVGFNLVPSMQYSATGATNSSNIGNIGINDMWVKACKYDIVPLAASVCVYEDVFEVDTIEHDIEPD